MPGSILGNPVRRREDPALVTGRAPYTGDLKLSGCLQAAFVRSPNAHARIRSLDTSGAASLPGVIQIITAADLDVRAIAAFPFLKGRPALAAETVRFVGEPVAAVFGETREAAVDAAANVLVDWEPLPAVVDPAAGEELRVDRVGEQGGALEGAAVVVTGRFSNQRLAPVPIEPNAFAAAPDPETGGMKIWASTQVPHGLRDRLAGDLDLPPDRVRVIAPAVGGGFGAKGDGQGHETTFAQITADVLGVPMESIHVILSDTAEVPRGVGTFGSRSVQLGGTAIHIAAKKVLDEGRERAADLLEADAADIVVVPGRGLGVAGAPQSVVTWVDIAQAAGGDGLKVALDQAQPGPTFPFGCHVAVLEVDIETADTRLVKHVAVDDSGHIVNPSLADGQVQGGIAQGMAQALYEQVVFDDQGNPQTASLVDYLIPTAREMPEMALGRTVTPTPHNALGAKGIGESGTIGSTPAVQNAVTDAVAHLGVRHIDMPLARERVWRAIREATSTATAAG